MSATRSPPCRRSAARAAAVGVVLGALLLSAPAAGVDFRIYDQPLRLDVTETFLVAWHLDNQNRTYADDRYGEIQNRLNLGLSYQRFMLSIRVDTSAFFNVAECDSAGTCTSPSPPDHVEWWPSLSQGELRDRYRFRSIDELGPFRTGDTSIGPIYLPERIALTYSGRKVEATIGDHYVSLGRGLTLSLRKVDELGSDTDLRGGRVVVRHGPASGTLVAGVTNINNVDEATGRSALDPQDRIIGGRLTGTLYDLVTLGAQGAAFLYRRNATDTQGTDDRAFTGGFSLDAPRLWGRGNAYLEYAHASRHIADADAPGGDALYWALTGYHRSLSLLLEGKYYDGFPQVSTSLETASDSFSTIRYNNPPTVERVLADMDSVSPVLYVAGTRLRADYALTPDVAPYLSYAYFYDWTSDGALLDIHDPYGGVSVYWQEHRSHAGVSGGLRHSQERANTDPDEPLHPSQLHSLDAHVEVVAAQALTTRLSLEVTGRHRYRQKRLGIDEPARWNEGEWALGLRYSPLLVVAVAYEYTTEPDLPRPPCCSPDNLALCQSGQPMCENYHRLSYVNGQVSWNFRSGSSVRLFAGGQRGGLRCVSGVCRQFPPFMGIKAEAVVRF